MFRLKEMDMRMSVVDQSSLRPPESIA